WNFVSGRNILHSATTPFRLVTPARDPFANAISERKPNDKGDCDFHRHVLLPSSYKTSLVWRFVPNQGYYDGVHQGERNRLFGTKLGLLSYTRLTCAIFCRGIGGA